MLSFTYWKIQFKLLFPPNESLVDPAQDQFVESLLPLITLELQQTVIEGENRLCPELSNLSVCLYSRTQLFLNQNNGKQIHAVSFNPLTNRIFRISLLWNHFFSVAFSEIWKWLTICMQNTNSNQSDEIVLKAVFLSQIWLLNSLKDYT